jgi:PBP1b-binding outer membrane lipoprotein LpoB
MQRAKRAAGTAILAVILASCSGGGGGPSPGATVPEEPRTLQGQVLQDAQDVASQLEQRQADLESMLP